MSDVKNAFEQINEFMTSEAEKTLLLRGIADKEKNLYLLKSLNSLGKLKGLIYLIHTSEVQNAVKKKAKDSADENVSKNIKAMAKMA